VVEACNTSHEARLEALAREQLHSNDWQTREQALSTLSSLQGRGHKPDVETRRELSRLLEKETKAYGEFALRLKSEGRTTSQASDERARTFPVGLYDEYIKMLAYAVAFNKAEDGFPSLVRLLVETDYAVSPALLIVYGKEHIGFLIERTASAIPKEREVALSVLSVWMDAPEETDNVDTKGVSPLTQREVERVKPVFMKAAADPDYNIRYASLSGLRKLTADPAVVAMLESMVASDDEKFIREEAKRVLAAKK
jgi:hypothetical protein